MSDGTLLDQTAELLDERLRTGERFFAEKADDIARLCHRMAERFARGGRLLALGSDPGARTDARHVAVEFVHPVIVGKRALPALAVETESRLERLAGPDDIVMSFRGGSLTVALPPGDLRWDFDPPVTDGDIRQELVETLYHILWELVHVFFEHRGLLEGRVGRPRHDAGASSFLYPFLAEQEDDLDAVLKDVRRSVAMKSEEVGELRVQTLNENAEALKAAAGALRACFASGGHLLAAGNGGSATDAMDLVADLSAAGRPAIDLTEDPGIITAIANDIGTDVIFSRQVIAYGRPGDVLAMFSTSGNSENVIAALAQARRQDLITVAFVGYDGGRVATEQLADHVIVTRSQHIPRIQEAQASAYHVLTRLIG